MLQEASGHDAAFEKKLLDAYQQTCRPHISALEACLGNAEGEPDVHSVQESTRARNRKDACFSLHTIRGSSLQIGAARVAEATRALEEEFEGDGTEMRRRFKRLEAEFRRFVSVFEEYLSEGHASDIQSPVSSPREHHKTNSDPSGLPVAEQDNNLKSQSM